MPLGGRAARPGTADGPLGRCLDERLCLMDVETSYRCGCRSCAGAPRTVAGRVCAWRRPPPRCRGEGLRGPLPAGGRGVAGHCEGQGPSSA
jgi:hypothetical protein